MGVKDPSGPKTRKIECLCTRKVAPSKHIVLVFYLDLCLWYLSITIANEVVGYETKYEKAESSSPRDMDNIFLFTC